MARRNRSSRQRRRHTRRAVPGACSTAMRSPPCTTTRPPRSLPRKSAGWRPRSCWRRRAPPTTWLLRARGYRAGAAGKPLPTEGNLLDLEIQRWEPDSWTEPTFVIVGVTATLRDGATGRVLWSAHPPIGPVATPGAVVLGSAYEIA